MKDDGIEELFEDIEEEEENSDEEIISTSSTSPNISFQNYNNHKNVDKHQNEKITANNKINNTSNRNNVNNKNNLKNINTTDKNLSTKLSDVKNKNINNLGSTVGRKIGNKINGKSEEEKGNVEKVVDDVAGKAASTIITTASGGTISGPLADAAGEVVAQSAKKQVGIFLKIFLIILVAIIFFLLLLVSVFIGEDDQSETNVMTETYISGDMSDDELIKRLIYLGICRNRLTCAQSDAFKFYEHAKSVYNEYKENCNGLSDSYLKNGGKPCEVTLNVPLLLETLSYGKTDKELFGRKKWTSTQNDDIDNLSLAQASYIHEKCYQLKIERKCKTTNVPVPGAPNATYPKQTCVTVETKVPQDLYYFQISFDKYISYLKYGETSTHPNYKDKIPLVIGDYQSRVCTGVQDDSIIGSSQSGSSTTDGGTTTSSNEKLNELFPNGLPTSSSQMEAYLVTVSVPIVDINGNKSTKSLRVHKQLANDVISIFTEIANSKFPIKEVYCYSWRSMASNSSSRSHHSYGVACDINPNENYMIKNGAVISGSYWKPGVDPYSITSDGPVVKAFESKGWTWGGNWNSSKDYMHFSYTGQ